MVPRPVAVDDLSSPDGSLATQLSRDTGIQDHRGTRHRTEGELTLRTMLADFSPQFSQYSPGFPSQKVLATPTFLIPLAPAARQRFSVTLRQSNPLARDIRPTRSLTTRRQSSCHQRHHMRTVRTAIKDSQRVRLRPG